LRNYHTDFHNSTTIFHSRQQCTGLKFFHILDTTYFLLCFVTVLMIAVNEYEVISHCDTDLQMTKDVEHLIIYLLAICVSSWVKYLFKSFADWPGTYFVAQAGLKLTIFLTQPSWMLGLQACVTISSSPLPVL
jgi:hypothetical protein